MLRIAVVDDELAMREQLCGYVRQYAEENHLAVEVVPFADGAAIAMPYQTGFDIIMLDVDMPLLGGMPPAERTAISPKTAFLPSRFIGRAKATCSHRHLKCSTRSKSTLW